MDLSVYHDIFKQVQDKLNQQFLAKNESISLMLIAAIAGEHMLLIGPPGTAKSALIRSFSKLTDAKYFEYLLTRFSEPNEIFGPIDIQSFRDGLYRRVTTSMLPEAEFVFLDEAFKANSAILNSLLTILNERQFNNGAQLQKVPLVSLFAASNEVPSSEDLKAVFDRFLLRVHSDNLESFHFRDLMKVGMQFEKHKSLVSSAEAQTLLPLQVLRDCQNNLFDYVEFKEDFLSRYKSLCFQLRGEGIAISDRRAVRILKLFAASAILNGRRQTNTSDFFILKHCWNNLDQREIIDHIIEPILDSYYAENPKEKTQVKRSNLKQLLGELHFIEKNLKSADQLSDTQLFSQLRHLQELKQAIAQHNNDTATKMLAKVEEILEHFFQRQ